MKKPHDIETNIYTQPTKYQIKTQSTSSKNMSDLCIKLRVEEVILGIGLTERVSSEKSLGGWPGR